MWSSSFWKQAAERAAKTFAQSLITVLGTGAGGLLDVGWKQALSVSALSALLSLLFSLVSSGVGPDDGPSLVSTEPATE
jgi:Putative lactococcus lactis phage r1t holin